MPDREKVILGIENCITTDSVTECRKTECPFIACRESCLEWLLRSALSLLKEQDEEHRRLLSWLGKFCRHIDNGDAWLTDEENIAFFKEKMKQQFGWNTD